MSMGVLPRHSAANTGKREPEPEPQCPVTRTPRRWSTTRREGRPGCRQPLRATRQRRMTTTGATDRRAHRRPRRDTPLRSSSAPAERVERRAYGAMWARVVVDPQRSISRPLMRAVPGDKSSVVDRHRHLIPPRVSWMPGPTCRRRSKSGLQRGRLPTSSHTHPSPRALWAITARQW